MVFLITVKCHEGEKCLSPSWADAQTSVDMKGKQRPICTWAQVMWGPTLLILFKQTTRLCSGVSGFHSYFPFKKPTLLTLELMTHVTILHSLAATESWDTPSQFSEREGAREPGPRGATFLQLSCWGSCGPVPGWGICCHNLHNKHLPSKAA